MKTITLSIDDSIYEKFLSLISTFAKKSIERGLKDVEEGRLVPYDQVKEKVKK